MIIILTYNTPVLFNHHMRKRPQQKEEMCTKHSFSLHMMTEAQYKTDIIKSGQHARSSWSDNGLTPKNTL